MRPTVDAERSSHNRRRRGKAVVTTERRPDRSSWEALWQLYHATFEPLQELALLNHLYARAEFDALLADERISKLIARDDTGPVGMAMITNELELVPQISPPFLRRRYPEQAARDAVFFGIMIFVADTHRRSTVFPRLIAGMGQMTAEASGVVVFDVCRHNLETYDFDGLIASMAGWFPHSEFEQVDAQHYFAVTVPVRPEGRLPIALASSAVTTPTDASALDTVPQAMTA